MKVTIDICKTDCVHYLVCRHVTSIEPIISETLPALQNKFKDNGLTLSPVQIGFECENFYNKNAPCIQSKPSVIPAYRNIESDD